MKTDFPVFSKDTYAFFRALKRNNDKTWFKANEERYQKHVRGPTAALVDRLPQTLGKAFPGIAISRRCISRINRDVRFSNNKDPYKTYVSLVFQDARVTSAKESGLSLYFGFDSSGFAYGAGMYVFEKTMRENFRRAVTHPVHGKEFAKIVAKLKKAGFHLEGKSLKKTPPGYDANHPNSEYLQYNGFYATKEMDPKAVFFGSKCDVWMTSLFIPLKDLFAWMRRMAIGDIKPVATKDRKTPVRDRIPMPVDLPDSKTTNRPQFDF